MLRYVRSWFETPHALNEALRQCIEVAEVEKKYILEATKQYVLEEMVIDSIKTKQRNTQRNRDRIENSKALQVIHLKNAMQYAIKFCWFLELSFYLAKIVYLESQPSKEAHSTVFYKDYVRALLQVMAKANFDLMKNILGELHKVSFIDLRFLSRCSECDNSAATMASSVPDRAKLESACLQTSIACLAWASIQNISSKDVAQYNILFPSIETIIECNLKFEPNEELRRLMEETEDVY